MKRALLGLSPLALVVATLAPGCGGNDTGTSMGSGNTETDTGSGDGDGDPTGDGDGDGTGDGDGDGTGDGDGDGAPGPDADMDGVTDAADNCPDVPNPNQLDFDGNAMGNVCDVLTFDSVTGTLNTTVNVDAGAGGSCSIPLMIDVTSGQILVQLDDDAAMARFEINNLHIADILDQQCMLLVNAQVSLTNFVMTNAGGPFPVGFMHSLAMHNGGQAAGMTADPHMMSSTADLTTVVNMGMPMMSPLMLDGGQLPPFTANVTMMGSTGTISWADPQFVVATSSFDITDPFPLTINVELRGMTGTLNLAP